MARGSGSSARDRLKPLDPHASSEGRVRAGGPLSGLRGSRRVLAATTCATICRPSCELQLASGELGLALLLEVGGASAYPVGFAV